MNPSPKRASNPGPVPDASGYRTQDSGNISDAVTYEDLEILDASQGSMSIGGNMHPPEIQVKQTNNLIEVSTGGVKGKCTPEKLFKYLVFLFCLLFLLITGIILGLKHSGETETIKQCLPGHYMFPYCIKCECTSDGSTLDCYDTGDCICKHGFDGSKCDKCKEGFTGNKCDECKPNITGHDCNQCKPNHFNYPLCQECVCNSNGSISLYCDEDYGDCSCKEGFAGIKCHECMPNVIGDKCDTCLPGFSGYPSCHEEEKILIASGYPSDAINTEIVDVEDPNFSCTNIEQFPVGLYAATGGLINGQKPFICGGRDYDWTHSKDCYLLTDTGSWVKDQRATLTTSRVNAGYGSVVLNNNLVLTGGLFNLGFDYLTSIEMVSPNTTAQALLVQLPTGIYGHCQVLWDSETFLVIGGSDSFTDSDETYLINIKINQRRNGASLKTARHDHACAELQLNGKTYIVVTGGYSDNLRAHIISTEVLDKSNVGQGWKRGDDFDLPVFKKNFQMVSSPDKKALYAIGGNDGNHDNTNDIFKFHCTDDINTCRWTKSETTLRFGREDFVAIPIPNSFADKLCSTDLTTAKPLNPTTGEPINPTTTADPTDPCGETCNDCKEEGFTGSNCDECKPNVIGEKCDACQANHYNYPLCEECNCDPDGSISLQCDNNGDCTCKTYSIGSKCNASCNDKLSWVGDNQCDDETNYNGCNYDGGDCCGDNINTNFCIECNCKHQSACGKGFQGWVGDGYCDDLTNNAGCNYDGGDCCGDDINTEYCSLCSCRNNGTTIQD